MHANIADLTPIAQELTGLDACFFCLGVSSAGMKEAEYTHITHDLTLAAASVLLRQSPQLTFIYVSGAGTDSTERGRSMWARVKGRTENALLAMPFKGSYMFRAGIIRPRHGIRSKTALYRVGYAVAGPLLAVLDRAAPRLVTDTERVGRAMLEVARHGAPARVLENDAINALAAAGVKARLGGVAS